MDRLSRRSAHIPTLLADGAYWRTCRRLLCSRPEYLDSRALRASSCPKVANHTERRVAGREKTPWSRDRLQTVQFPRSLMQAFHIPAIRLHISSQTTPEESECYNENRG